jgi:isocitrate dehydrogenase kinase/phosphatase
MKYKPNQKNTKIDVSTSKEEPKAAEQVVEDIAEVSVPVVEEPKQEEQKMDFDTWYIVRKHLIPAHHYKEILRADFKGRKLPKLCTIEQFDSALEKYGVKLA